MYFSPDFYKSFVLRPINKKRWSLGSKKNPAFSDFHLSVDRVCLRDQLYGRLGLKISGSGNHSSFGFGNRRLVLPIGTEQSRMGFLQIAIIVSGSITKEKVAPFQNLAFFHTIYSLVIMQDFLAFACLGLHELNSLSPVNSYHLSNLHFLLYRNGESKDNCTYSYLNFSLLKLLKS